MTRTIPALAVTAALLFAACGSGEQERTGPPTDMTTAEIAALADRYIDECVADGLKYDECKEGSIARAVLESEGLEAPD